MKKITAITSFDQVDALYKAGINLCNGCTWERAASCHEGRFDICTEQLKKNLEQIEEMGNGEVEH